jgi:hypothetical protein
MDRWIYVTSTIGMYGGAYVCSNIGMVRMVYIISNPHGMFEANLCQYEMNG